MGTQKDTAYEIAEVMVKVSNMLEDIQVLLQLSVSKHYDMRLSCMATAFKTQTQDSAYDSMSFEDRFSLLVDAEWAARKNNRLTRLIRNADYAMSDACIEGRSVFDANSVVEGHFTSACKSGKHVFRCNHLRSQSRIPVAAYIVFALALVGFSCIPTWKLALNRNSFFILFSVEKTQQVKSTGFPAKNHQGAWAH